MNASPRPHPHLPHLAMRVATGGGGAVARPRARWDRTPLWWIAVLFAIGSSCFLLAALASERSSVTRPGIGVTFFAGSICFTSAAYLQHWLAVRSASAAGTLRAHGRLGLLHPDRWPHAHVDALATLVQLVGTVFFNALNLLGSVAFGVAAVASLVEPSTNEPVSAAIANGGTAAGALCFLIGALLLLPDASPPAVPDR